MTQYVVFNPTAVVAHPSQELAARPGTLDGAKVGLLFNAKPNADVLLRRVQERIAAQHPGAAFVYRSKPTAARPMAPEVLDAMTGCDVVVNAYGD